MAFAAGAVTILSPCILPILPIILGSALDSGRYGPLALAAGLVMAFTVTGMAIATLSISMGFSPDLFSKIAAGLMIIFGLAMVSARLQILVSVAAAHATQHLQQPVAEFSPHGLGGQFTLGLLLGAAWTPCVGPTLGAAIAMAAQGQQLTHAATTMFLFALGTVTPLLILTTGAKSTMARRKDALRRFSGRARPLIGALLLLFGLAMLTGWMTHWEAFLLELMPEGLVNFIYRF